MMGDPSTVVFTALLLVLIVILAHLVSERKETVKPVFIGCWAFFLMPEPIVVAFDSLAGLAKGLDPRVSLSLCPCPIYLYAMPFAIWGRDRARWMSSAYIATLGITGGIVNFLYPVQLMHCSCLSFRGLHTMLYHGNLIFTFLVMLKTGRFSYGGPRERRYLLYASFPSLIMSVPANAVNTFCRGADCMYFTGAFPLPGRLLPNASRQGSALFMYALCIFVPMLFFLPSMLKEWRNMRKLAF